LAKSLEPDRVERLRTKLYEKAKREPDFRFYSLYDKVCWTETLSRSYRQAKANAGAAGVDGVRFEDIESYGVERWLGELQKELLEESYRPQPVRRVVIPKPGGGERPLGIPTIRDRVAQTAVVLILEPLFEADFEDNVYAYRPERSAQDALAEVMKRLLVGQKHVVDGDVEQYFDTIPHADLLQSVARRVADGKVLHLLKLWLKSPVEERDEKGNRRMTGGKKSKRGTPQGGVISPLLANIYINRLLRLGIPSEGGHRFRREGGHPFRGEGGHRFRGEGGHRFRAEGGHFLRVVGKGGRFAVGAVGEKGSDAVTFWAPKGDRCRQGDSVCGRSKRCCDCCKSVA
jgi:RNA-directed DNA polymerase